MGCRSVLMKIKQGLKPLGRAVERLFSAAKTGLTAKLMVAGACFCAPLAYADFKNGSFEDGFNHWTVTPLKVPSTGMPVSPPTKYSDLGLTSSSDGSVSVVVGTTTDSRTNNLLRTPQFGDKSARVGDNQTGNRAASIQQKAFVGVGDVDPADGKVHIRFALAPVLDDISHTAKEQPYFFVEILNKTKGTQLFHTLNFSRQTGVAWQKFGSYLFTDWQAVDVAPGPSFLDPGDEVEVIIVGAGCSQGGHAGYVYADSDHGLTHLPGPYVKAEAAQYAVRSGNVADNFATLNPAVAPADRSTVTINYQYNNGGSAPMPGSELVITSPQDQDVRNPSSGAVTAYQHNLRVDPTSVPASCTVVSIPEPSPNTRVDLSLGTIDKVTCPLGTLNPGTTGDISLRWIIPTDAVGGDINHGNYLIQSSATPALLGPLTKTALTTNKLVDLKSTVSNSATSIACGATTTYAVTLENAGPEAGPVGVVIANNVPSGLTANSWSCTASGATLACPAASGTGSIAGTTSTAWPVGEQLVYSVNATANACPGGATTITFPVSVSLPTGDLINVDPEKANSTGVHVLNAGPALQPLAVTTSGAGTGSVKSVLSGISCTKPDGVTQCTDVKQFPSGSEVALYATAPAGSIFSGWSGVAGCTGIAQPCMVSMSAAQSVVAAFELPVNVTTNVVAGGGSVTPPTGTITPVVSGGTTSFTVTPAAGYSPVFAGTCPAGSFVANTYTTGAVTADCTVDISFTNTGTLYTATPNSPAGGSIIGGDKVVAPGGSATWKLVPNSGFLPSATVGGTCGAGTWNTSKTEYTVSPINANCTVNFAFVNAYTVSGTVSATSPGTGTITAGGVQTVATGNSAVFTLSRAGEVESVGSSCTGGSFNADKTQYTVPNVTANCAMVFKFAAAPAVASTAAIPTLNEWGVLILSGVMGLLVLGVSRRRNA
jgi:uncharacterized repeat protein (TIGR01451 family)